MCCGEMCCGELVVESLDVISVDEKEDLNGNASRFYVRPCGRLGYENPSPKSVVRVFFSWFTKVNKSHQSVTITARHH
ncbi:hypothetical protein EAF00_001952 [Botryotinia globosa]|nr:hypothetical protein EAF00_001952 [Botryotinia globosa]